MGIILKVIADDCSKLNGSKLEKSFERECSVNRGDDLILPGGVKIPASVVGHDLVGHNTVVVTSYVVDPKTWQHLENSGWIPRTT